MNRNDNHVPLPDKSQSSIDRAFNEVVRQCRASNRSYFGDIVKQQLGNYLQRGYSPQKAADALMRRAPR